MYARLFDMEFDPDSLLSCGKGNRFPTILYNDNGVSVKKPFVVVHIPTATYFLQSQHLADFACQKRRSTSLIWGRKENSSVLRHSLSDQKSCSGHLSEFGYYYNPAKLLP